jgi:hypothetical protein
MKPLAVVTTFAALLGAGIGTGATLLIAKQGPDGPRGPTGAQGVRGAHGPSGSTDYRTIYVAISRANRAIRLATLAADIARQPAPSSVDLEALSSTVDDLSSRVDQLCNSPPLVSQGVGC